MPFFAAPDDQRQDIARVSKRFAQREGIRGSNAATALQLSARCGIFRANQRSRDSVQHFRRCPRRPMMMRPEQWFVRRDNIDSSRSECTSITDVVRAAEHGRMPARRHAGGRMNDRRHTHRRGEHTWSAFDLMAVQPNCTTTKREAA